MYKSWNTLCALMIMLNGMKGITIVFFMNLIKMNGYYLDLLFLFVSKFEIFVSTGGI